MGTFKLLIIDFDHMNYHINIMSEILFLVNNTRYSLSLKKIINFPIKTAFLNLLVDNHLNQRCGVQTIDGALVIKSDYHNFDKIVAIYNDPCISLTKLLEFDKLSEFILRPENLDPFFKTPMEVNQPIFVDDDIYEHFLAELDFYGISDLFASTLDISQDTMVAKLEKRLKDMFRDFVAIYGGYLSGSFVLQTILDQTWENSDIDIYMNSHLVDGIAQSKLSWESYVPCPIYQKDIYGTAKCLMDYFECKDYTIHTQKELDNGYGLCSHLSHVIKFTFENVKIDIVIVTCTVPFFIGQFDFDFNRLYYDLYSVYAFNWTSIKCKKSINKYARERYNTSESCKYADNLNRIQKYIDRGFVITKDHYADNYFN